MQVRKQQLELDMERGHAGFCSVAFNSSPGRKTGQAARPEGPLGDAAMGAVAVDCYFVSVSNP